MIILQKKKSTLIKRAKKSKSATLSNNDLVGLFLWLIAM